MLPTGSAREPIIRARTSVGESSVHLEIIDNGPGIAAADLPRIWDPFWTTKEDGVGTGLGLSVVHGIVAQHDGTIDVESTIDVGTTFTLRFPRYTQPIDPAAENGERDEMGDGFGLDDPPMELASRPLDLLLVDDEPALVTMLTRYFTARGHAVMPAYDGEQALRLAEHSSFDAVICDLRMPGIDGVEVLRRLRAMPSGAQARFVLATGDTASPAARERASEVPGTLVVDKPYEVEALRRLVEDDAT
jgi:CheY-like chemotaxis protein